MEKRIWGWMGSENPIRPHVKKENEWMIFPEIKIKKARREILALARRLEGRNPLILFFHYSPKVSFGFVRVSLINVKENFQHVAYMLKNCDSCVVETIFCIKCSLCSQVLNLGPVKTTKSSTKKVRSS